MYHYQLPWFKKKQLFFAKELSTENFQASDGWLQRWKEGDNIFMFPKSRNLSHQRCLMRSRKRPFQLFCQTITWKTFTGRMNSDIFVNAFQIKLTSWSQKSAMEES